MLKLRLKCLKDKQKTLDEKYILYKIYSTPPPVQFYFQIKAIKVNNEVLKNHYTAPLSLHTGSLNGVFAKNERGVKA